MAAIANKNRPPAMSMAERADGRRLGDCDIFLPVAYFPCPRHLGPGCFAVGWTLAFPRWSVHRQRLRPLRVLAGASCLSSARAHGIAQDTCHVQRPAAGTVADLMPTRKPVGGDESVRGGRAQGGQ